jgi:hypothetical protein
MEGGGRKVDGGKEGGRAEGGITSVNSVLREK